MYGRSWRRSCLATLSGDLTRRKARDTGTTDTLCGVNRQAGPSSVDGDWNMDGDWVEADLVRDYSTVGCFECSGVVGWVDPARVAHLNREKYLAARAVYGVGAVPAGGAAACRACSPHRDVATAVAHSGGPGGPPRAAAGRSTLAKSGKQALRL